MKNYILLALLFLLLNTGFAQTTFTWNGTTSTDWNTATNWTPAAVPTAADYVVIVTGANNCVLAANTTVTNLTITSGTLNLNTATLFTTGIVNCNGGTIINGIFNTTATTIGFTATTFNASIQGNVTTTNLGGGTFNAPFDITGVDIIVKSGVFNSPVILTKTGGGSNYVTIGTVTFNSTLTINQQSNTGYIMLGFGNNIANFNDDITVTCTGTEGINLGYTYLTGSPILAAGKTIKVGPAGFSSGYLRLGGFTQLGTTPLNLTLTGTAGLIICTSATHSTFAAPVTITAPDITIQGGVFNNTTTFNKTGGGSNNNGGLKNIFNAPLFINQQSNGGYFMLGYNSNDEFNDDVTVTATGSGGVNIGWQFSHTSSPVLAAGKLLKIGSAGFGLGLLRLGGFTQLGTTPMSLVLTGSAMLEVNKGLNPSTFGGNLTITAPSIVINGGTFNGVTTFTKTGGVDNIGGNTYQNIFNAPLFINQQSTTGYFMLSYNTNDLFNDNVTVTNTGTQGIGLGWSSGIGTPTLAVGKVIQVGGAGFTGGYLRLGGFTVLGTNPQNIILTGTAAFFTQKNTTVSTYNGPLTVTAPDVHIQGGVFNGITTFTKTGGGSNNNSGFQNIFNAPLFINQQSNGGYFLLGYNADDMFNDNITVTSTGTGGIAFGWNTGNGLPVLAAGKTISVGSAGFSAGYLRFGSFTQLGSAPIILPFTGNAALYINQNANLIPTTFNGSFNCTAADLYIQGGVFNGATVFTKTAGSDNHNIGIKNTFNSTLAINQQSTSGYFMLGYNSNDVFNDDITVTNTGNRLIFLGYTGGSGMPTLAAGKTIKVGAAGFTGGTLYFGNFTQLGNSPINLPFTGTTAKLQTHKSIFGGNITSVTPSFLLDSTIFNSVLDLTKTGPTGDYSYGANVFNGVSTFTNTGSSFIVLGNTKPDVWNADVTFTSAGSDRVLPCWNSTGNVFNGNIYVNSIGTSVGIHFCNYSTTSATLAAGKTIQVGSLGYTSGYLKLQRFTQLGNTPITLNFATTAGNVEYGPFSKFGGNLTSTTPGVLFNESIFSGTVNCTKTGSSYEASTGGNVFNGITTITNNSIGTNSYIVLGNVKADVFNANTTLINNGEHRIYFAHNHTGLTTLFNANLTLISNRNSGADQWSFFACEGINTSYTIAGDFTLNNMGTVQSNCRFLNATGTYATYNGKTIVNLSNTNAATQIEMGIIGTSTYNGDITVSNTGGASGIFFNNNLGSSVLNNKSISLGVGGFTTGTLSLLRFTQLGTIPQTLLQTTGNARLLLGPSSRFDGDVNFAFPQVLLNGCTYNGTATIQKNGAADNGGNGGNVFNGTTIITNSGTGYLLTGNFNADVFNANTTFINSGENRMYFAHNHTGFTTVFNANLTLISNKSGGTDPWSFLVCEGINTSYTIAGDFTLNNMGALQSICRFLNGTGTYATYNGKTAINVSNTHANTQIEMGNVGTSTYNGDITVSNTGGSNGIFFNSTNSGSSVLNNKSIGLGVGGFTTGSLSLLRFTQLGAIPQTLLQTTGVAKLILGPSSKFDGDVNFAFPQVFLNGCTYNGTATIQKNGSSDNGGNGGNIFNGTTIITNSGKGYLLTGNFNADVFNANTTFINSGENRMYFAHNHTGFTTVFNANLTLISNKSGGTDPWSFLVCEGANTSYTIAGDYVLNNMGALQSNCRFLNGTGTYATYNGKTAISVSNTHTATQIEMGSIGTSTYNGDITVSNTGGSSGIFFNNNISGSSVLNNKSISLGVGGFTTGSLSLLRFTQLGAIPQTLLQTTGVAKLLLGPTSRFDGDVNFSFPRVFLQGTTYNGTATIEKNGASDDYAAGGNTFNGTTIINNSGTGYLLTGANNADAFNATTTFNNTGAHTIYLAWAHTGQTTTFGPLTTFNTNKTVSVSGNSYLMSENANSNVRFNGKLIMNIGGTANNSTRISNNVANTPLYNGDVELNLTNTNVATAMYMGNSGTSTYNGDIKVASTGGASGIYFNNNTTSASNLNNKTISLGTGGFTSGVLNLPRFSQNGNVPQTMLQTTGTATIYLGVNSKFDGDVNFNFPRVFLQGTTYNGTATIEKNGAGDDYAAGGNTFNNTTVINNSGTGYLLTGATNADAFNANTTFNNSGAHTIYLAHNHIGQTTTFGPLTTFNTTKTVSTSGYSYLISENANSNVRFNGKLIMNIGGTANNSTRISNNVANVPFYNGDVELNLTNTNASTAIYMGNSGTSTYNGDIKVASTGGANGIYFNNTTTANSIQNNKTISLGTGGFTAGTLYINRYEQNGAVLQTMLQTTGTARVYLGSTSRFDGDVNFAFPQVYLNGCIYNGTTVIEKNGATDNGGNGGNVFNGVTTLNNSGSGYLLTGNVARDLFNGITTMNNTGTGAMYFAHNHAGATTVFAQNVTLNSTKTGAVNSNSFVYCEGASTNVRFDGNLTANIGGAFRSEFRSLGNTATTAIYNGDVNVNITNTSTATVFYLGIFGNSTFNGNVVLQNTGNIASLQFNNSASASSIMAAGKSITTGALGYASGLLLLSRFTQLGTTLNNLNCTGNTALTFGPTSNFGGGVTSISPSLIYTNSIFNGAVNGTKTGTTVDNSGSNTFNAAMSLTNNGTGSIAMASSGVDVYNGDATFIQNNTGIVYPNHANNCPYAGNITVGTSAAYAITFGQTAPGIATLVGTAPQTINKIGAAPNPTFTRLVVNKSVADVTLNTRVNISSNLSLIQGIVNTTQANIINMNNASTTSTGNSLSYISGPMNYDMALSATTRVLNFPIGKTTDWRPAVLTAKHTTGTSYTYNSEVFNASAKALWWTLPATLLNVSSMHYWDINRVITSTGVAAPTVDISGNQTVQLFYGANDGVTDVPNLTIVKNKNTALTTWFDIGATGATVGTGSVSSTSIPTAFNSFSRFTLANKVGGTNPLPVQLLSFDAKAYNQKVNLTWSTATETNNKGFEIEKSTDGINFEYVAFVASQGNGNASFEQTYTAIDNTPYNGVSYYRLKQTDFNGAYEYSDVKAVEFNTSSFVTLYPNPATTFINIKVGEQYTNATFKIINVLGTQMLNVTEFNTDNTASVNVASFAAGIYFLEINTGKSIEKIKFVIIK
jgi:hypothetical protein